MQDQGKPGKRAPARDRITIYYDILRSIVKQEETEGRVRITWVQNQVNLASDRLREHLREMQQLELLGHGERLASTKKGREFIAEYENVHDVLKRFALT
jgi:predicted transcriptional regulator